MDNVVLNDTMKQVATNEAEVSVNRSKSTLDECPVLCIKVRHIGMSMMQVCNGNFGCM